MTLFLSRIRLSRAPSVLALSSVLSPSDAGARLGVYHRLLWSAFADSADRKRDFLWRDAGQGAFYTLSARPPQPLDIFEHHEVRPFAPSLTEGASLRFSLRANATRTKRDGSRVDVVMDALQDVPSGERGPMRMAIAAQEGKAWLDRIGAAAGFVPHSVEVEDYSALALPEYRGPRKGQPQFGILELAGTLKVTDPGLFLPKLAAGFGRAKAFGCGLMLVQRG